MRQYLFIAKIAGVLLVLVLLFRLNGSLSSESITASTRSHAGTSSHIDTASNSKPDTLGYANPAVPKEDSPNRYIVGVHQDAKADSDDKTKSDLEKQLAQAKSEIALLKSAQKTLNTKKPSTGKSFETRSWKSDDGTVEHYILDRPVTESTKKPVVLHLTITRDHESWGRNPTEAMRTIYDHLKMVTNTTLLPEQMSIGLLTASRKEYERYIKIFTPDPKTAYTDSDSNSTYFDFAFRRVTLILHTADTRAALPGKKGGTTDTSRESRHNIPQHERRAILAKLRNYLQFVALQDETHVAWLDSDVYKYSSDTLMEVMAKRTRTTDDVEIGILTARCRRGEPELADAWLLDHPEFSIPDDAKDSDSAAKRKEIEEMRGKEGGKYEIIAHKTNGMGHYDLNAWAGRRTSPSVIEQEGLWRDISSWTPSGAPNGMVRMLDGVIDGTDNEDVRQLDSVGGTIIVMTAELVKMGLIFPTGYFVGMTFEHGEGYDGIETEGLCLLSRSFSRDGNSTCYTLGGDWSVWHTIF